MSFTHRKPRQEVPEEQGAGPPPHTLDSGPPVSGEARTAAGLMTWNTAGQSQRPAEKVAQHRGRVCSDAHLSEARNPPPLSPYEGDSVLAVSDEETEAESRCCT